LSALADELLTRVHDEERKSTNKVTVVGTGQVGMAAAFAMMTQVADVLNLSTTCTWLFLVNGDFVFMMTLIHYFDTDDVNQLFFFVISWNGLLRLLHKPNPCSLQFSSVGDSHIVR